MKSETKSRSKAFKAVDFLLIAGAVIPLIFGIVLYVLIKPASSGIEITGAKILFTVDMPLQSLPITESQVNSWIVIVTIFFLCLYLTHGISATQPTARQHLAEWIVEKTENLVRNNMGEFFDGFAPFVAAIMGLSAFSSLLTLIGLFPPTSDLNVVGGWAVLVFILITHYKLKCGVVHYIKSFGDPVPLLAPLNVISEIATPVSMAFRHYGNVLSGSVISVLVAVGLQGLSQMVLGKLPGVLGEFPLLQIGLPAVLSVYFDLFSGCLQAFIFAMLTMLYISTGFPAENYKEKMKNKN
ncbi:MAG: F0F1 ATP synthase subunit A [Acutalibacteraceae bacterium]|nr:F0F1 ATP synthase subunit A [Acutalibacteraceae bacterium]